MKLRQHLICNHAAKLHAVICYADSNSLPALGGIRVLNYVNFSQAIADCKQLATAMYHKAKLYQLPVTGGKCVLMQPQSPFNRQRLFAALGEAIEKLCGRYICAMDRGVTCDDMATIANHTQYATNYPSVGGSPARYTAAGVMHAMRMATRTMLNQHSLKTTHVLIQGGWASWVRASN